MRFIIFQFLSVQFFYLFLWNQPRKWKLIILSIFYFRKHDKSSNFDYLFGGCDIKSSPILLYEIIEHNIKASWSSFDVMHIFQNNHRFIALKVDVFLLLREIFIPPIMVELIQENACFHQNVLNEKHILHFRI